MLTSPRTFLFVEDDVDAAELLAIAVDSWNHQMLTAQGISEAVQIINAASNIHILITDLHLSDGFGFDVIRAFNDKFPSRPVVLTSGTLDGLNAPADILDLAKRGLLSFMPKPYSPELHMRPRIEAAPL